MKLDNCECVSVGREFLSKKNNDRPFRFSIWFVDDPDYSDGVYFRAFTWTDTDPIPVKGDKGLCVKVNGFYQLVTD
mgnify:FL=1